MNIHVIIPVADPAKQDFANLVSELCGNYVAVDHITTKADGEEEVVENPYKNSDPVDLSGKITLVSLSAINAPEGAASLVVNGELNIAKMWNAGVANATDATHVVVLNEVSSINPAAIVKAIQENDADVVNLSDGGCFVVKPSVSADEQYRWWFADVELFANNETAVVRDEFLDIVQANAITIDETMQAIVDADMETFNSK